ncbi:MAG TPA: phosphoglycerate kinase, partial [Desulfobacterales bacterium]|nr:phosphoglycerate kinase [Desulfobacterales bacterium]
MKRIQDVVISDKRVFCRVDFNVPLDEFRNIRDDSRIRAILPTLKYALDHKAKLVIASHLGRPRGRAVSEMGLSPVAKRLGRLLEKEVRMAGDCVGPDVKKLVSGMKPGDVVLLENLRFHPQEQKNEDEFAKELASICDVYINDAFAVSHRVNASVAAITKYAPLSAAGFLLQKELDYFEKAMAAPQRPL